MRSQVARKKVSATTVRNLRTLLLLNVFEPEEIGDRIKQARERAGLRQEDLADLIGMSTRQVQNYEAGDSKQYAKLKAIAGATGTSVEWLLRGEPVEDDEVTSSEVAALGAQLEAVRAGVERVESLLRGDAARDAPAKPV
jgi:transcriptional regulator with XRE-family HTH domain